MSKTKEILRTLWELKMRGFMHHSDLKVNGRINHTSYSPKEDDITIMFVSGYGVNEKKHTITFMTNELNDNLALFIDPIKQQSKYGDITISEDKKKENKPKTFLTMSEENENNFTGMRKHLFNAMRRLEKGEIKPEEAKAMSGLAQSITNSAKVEMQFRVAAGKTVETKMIE